MPGVPDFGVGPTPVPGRPDELAAGVVRLTAPNPGLMTGPGTNTYLIGRDELAVIDPGPDDEAHREAILSVAGSPERIRTIAVTHTHIDHAPGAAALAGVTGARVVGFGPAEGFAPDVRAGDGWTLSLSLSLPGGRGGSGEGDGGFTLEAVHTPGHASDHLCWLIREHQMLLTGDHVMHGSTVVIRPPDGDLHTYLRSLARVRDAVPPITTLAPGHGRLMDHVTEIVDALIAHRLGRHQLVAAALGRLGEGAVDDLLPEVYADVTAAQLPVARFTLWAHLRALGGEQRAVAVDVRPGEDAIETRWRATATVTA
jgi:glyoxylase-like metal-dependent hydrolase (beta-lactamase superfamily II)